MPSVEESWTADTDFSAAAKLGTETLSLNQKVEFVKYKRLVLPLDGFIFWVRATELGAGAEYNGALFNATTFNRLATPGTPKASDVITVQCSLHYQQDNLQNEDESFAKSTIIFTSETQVQDFDLLGPEEMYVGTWGVLRFSFNKMRPQYRVAGIWHYTGDALYPALETQLVDDPRTFDARSLVVSNSLPAWLALNGICPVYPSFALPNNLTPPYAAVHIEPSGTRALQAVPLLGSTSSHSQLATDHVRVTLYGLRNAVALNYMDYILEYMNLHDDVMGLMNMPIMRDEKRTQSEFGILAMKKTIEFDVSYYQSTIRNLSRQLILEAIPTFIVQ